MWVLEFVSPDTSLCGYPPLFWWLAFFWILTDNHFSLSGWLDTLFSPLFPIERPWVQLDSNWLSLRCKCHLCILEAITYCHAGRRCCSRLSIWEGLLIAFFPGRLCSTLRDDESQSSERSFQVSVSSSPPSPVSKVCTFKRQPKTLAIVCIIYFPECKRRSPMPRALLDNPWFLGRTLSPPSSPYPHSDHTPMCVFIYTHTYI